MAYVLRVDIDTIFERKMVTISERDTNIYKISTPLNFSNFKRDFAAKLCNFTNLTLWRLIYSAKFENLTITVSLDQYHQYMSVVSIQQNIIGKKMTGFSYTDILTFNALCT